MKIYLDTSVLSAMFDTRNPERLEITREFFAGRVADSLVVSELTLAEIAATLSVEMHTAMSEVIERCQTVSVTPGAWLPTRRDCGARGAVVSWRKTVPRSNRKISIDKEFPGDEALQQVHLARKALLAAAKRKRVTLGAYVRSLSLLTKNTTRAGKSLLNFLK